MGLLCNVDEFTNSLGQMVELLEDEYIEKKGLKPTEIPKLNEFRNFVKYIYEKFKNAEIKSYEELVEKLNNFEATNFKNCQIKAEDVKNIVNYMGLLLDAVQILKESTDRYQKIKGMLEKSLERTGHTFILNELNEEELNFILSEIRKTTALLIMLEIMMRISGTKINPLANLRRSMSDRYPEEYFANLMAGWVAEISFKEKILELPLQRTGVDQNYNLFLERPKDMGVADFLYDGKRIELQRTSPDKFKIKKNNDFYIIDTPLKLHKITNSDIIVLWIGGINEIENIIKCDNDKKGILYLIRLNPLLKILTIKIKTSVLSVPKPTKKGSNEYKEAFEKIKKITKDLNNIKNLLSPKSNGNLLWSFINFKNFLKQSGKLELINRILEYTQKVKSEIVFLKKELSLLDKPQEKRDFIVKHIDSIKNLKEKTEFLSSILNEFNKEVENSNVPIDEKITYVSNSGNEKVVIETKNPEIYCSDTIIEKIFN
ncbi:hypothetical protein [Nautilia lithotrophica]